MKLLMVLMLTALPLYCYAGSGCQLLEFLVDKAFDPEVSVSEFQEYLQEFIDGDNSAQAAAELKQCFLNQSNKTLHNCGVIMVISFFFLCAPNVPRGVLGTGEQAFFIHW
uniref:Secretoglobin family 2A member 2 n=1 Tax=Cebus imitator TaxID=2715852 RepID=A0A2K5PZR6_CEBIM